MIMVLDLTAMNRSSIQVWKIPNHSNCNRLFSSNLVHKILSGLSTIPTANSVYVLWEPLIPVSDVSYEYEVAYSVDPECSSDPVSLPDGYTLYYPRTSNQYIEVVGLMSGTCYVFGVRAYTSVTDSPGEFSLIQGNTISNEGYIVDIYLLLL